MGRAEPAKIAVMLRTTTYFDGRPDARFFMADIDGLIVSVRENLPTYAVTDGEVWIACRIHARCIERRWESTRIARRAARALRSRQPRIVRRHDDDRRVDSDRARRVRDRLPRLRCAAIAAVRRCECTESSRSGRLVERDRCAV